MIFLDRVDKRYRSGAVVKTVLDDVSCTIDTSRSIGILGLNGAGKSTLMRLLSGVEQPDAGTIRRAARISFPLGFSGCFAGSLTGRENAAFVARVYGVNVRAAVEYVEDFSELGRYFDLPFSTYSSGMRARLAFGTSLSLDFEVYLVDEITAVGDATFYKKAKDAFNERRRRSSVIMVSHAPYTITDYCERAAILSEGKLVFFENLAEAFAEYDKLTATKTVF